LRHQTERPLAEVVRELKSSTDSESGFRLLFHGHYSQVAGFFQRKGLPPEDCSDLAQEVFLYVHRNIGNLRDEAQFTPWLFSVARGVLKSELERRHAQKRGGPQLTGIRRETALNPDEVATAAGGPLTRMLDREKLQAVIDAMKELPAQMRRCFQLRFAAETSYEEIAVIMGISVNTVKAHIHKARHQLKQRLEGF